MGLDPEEASGLFWIGCYIACFSLDYDLNSPDGLYAWGDLLILAEGGWCLEGSRPVSLKYFNCSYLSLAIFILSIDF
jgi:hypothetical protein